MDNLENSHQIIQIQTKELDCHPAAIEAYIFDEEIKKQYNYKLIFKDIINHISRYSFPVVTRSTDNRYQYISGWHWIEINNEKDKLSVILTNENLQSDKIKEIAWSYVLGNQLKSWPHSRCFAHLEQMMKSLPKKLLKDQLDLLDKKSIKTAIEDISGQTRAIVRKQIENAGF